MASTINGAMDPANIALKTAVSNSRTEGALSERNVSTAITTGIAARTVRMRRRQRPES
jgi:hypothetical protein